MIDRTSCISAGFLAPDSAVDYDEGTANNIAVLAEQWASCFACGQQYGKCTVVNGSSPYDQFSPFRNTSIASYLSEPLVAHLVAPDIPQALPKAPCRFAELAS